MISNSQLRVNGSSPPPSHVHSLIMLKFQRWKYLSVISFSFSHDLKKNISLSLRYACMFSSLCGPPIEVLYVKYPLHLFLWSQSTTWKWRAVSSCPWYVNVTKALPLQSNYRQTFETKRKIQMQVKINCNVMVFLFSIVNWKFSVCNEKVTWCFGYLFIW